MTSHVHELEDNTVKMTMLPKCFRVNVIPITILAALGGGELCFGGYCRN